MKKIFILILLIWSCSDNFDENDLEIISQELISNENIRVRTILKSDTYHFAFTDLFYFNNNYYLSFRKALIHEESESEVIILKSKTNNLEEWEIFKTFSQSGKDFRDPKFFEFEEKLYIHFSLKTLNKFYRDDYYVEIHEKSLPKMITKTPHKIDWVWRLTSYNSNYYGFGYDLGKPIVLYEGIKSPFNLKSIKTINLPGSPSEVCLKFKNDKAYALVRNYTYSQLIKFKINSLDKIEILNLPFNDIGGPNFLFYEEYMIIIGRVDFLTKIYSYHLEKGEIKELATLPSAGDNSYAGMVQKDDKFIVSYYSEDDNKASTIRLAEIDIKELLK